MDGSAPTTTAGSPDEAVIFEALTSDREAAMDDEPVLTVTDMCYSICSPESSTPEYALYPNGTLVHTDDPGGTWRMAAIGLDDDELRDVAVLAAAAGLVGGGTHAAGTRACCEDGGAALFESRILGVRTYVHAPHLGTADGADGGAATRRADLMSLRRLLGSLARIEGAAEMPLRWVLVGEAVGGEAQIRWPQDEHPIGVPPCLAFDPVAVPEAFDRLTEDPDQASWVRFGDDRTYAVNLRPLLPHQTGCGPVQEQLVRIQVSDATLDLYAQD